MAASICSVTSPPQSRGSMISRQGAAPRRSSMRGGSAIWMASRKVSHLLPRVERSSGWTRARHAETSCSLSRRSRSEAVAVAEGRRRRNRITGEAQSGGEPSDLLLKLQRRFGDVPRTLHHAGFTLRESIEPEVIFLLQLRTGQPEFRSHRHPSPAKAL